MGFTPQQQAIIDHPVDNILVSAAAGSGKTTVMTERIVQRILNGDLDIERVLVLTFTNNAASHMKHKIEAKLMEKIEALQRETTPDLSILNHLNDQLQRIGQAQISTIHAFCMKMIRTYGYRLNELNDADQKQLLFNVRQAFTVADSRTLALMFTKIFKRIVRQKLSSDDPDFEQMVDCFFKNNLDHFEAFAYQMISDLRSLPDYRTQLMNKLQNFETDSHAWFDSKVSHFYMREYLSVLKTFLKTLPEKRQLLESSNAQLIKDSKKWFVRKSEYLESLQEIQTFAESLCQDVFDENLDLIPCVAQKWAMIKQFGQSFKLPTFRKLKAWNDFEDKTEFVDVLCSLWVPVLNPLNASFSSDSYQQYCTHPHLRGLFLLSIDQEMALMQKMVRPLFSFCHALLLLDQAFSNERSVQGVMDFSDFEQLAYELSKDAFVRHEYLQMFDEIYVDEFQDTSHIQLAILDAIASKNLFVVGDIKQSIYGFRHAKPALFRNMEIAYQDQPQLGQTFYLPKNFRSVESILSTVNRLFKEILIGHDLEIDYNDRHAFEVQVSLNRALLTSAAESSDHEPNGVYIVLNSEVSSENKVADEHSLSNEINEQIDQTNEMNLNQAVDPDLSLQSDQMNESTKAIIKTIRTLMRQSISKETDNGQLIKRPIEYRDICVLYDVNESAYALSDALASVGIPSEMRVMKFTKMHQEQRLMMALIQVLAGELDDFAWVTVLNSSLWLETFSEDDLWLIRVMGDHFKSSFSQLVNGMSHTYWTCLLSCVHFYERYQAAIESSISDEKTTHLMTEPNLFAQFSSKFETMLKELSEKCHVPLIRILKLLQHIYDVWQVIHHLRKAIQQIRPYDVLYDFLVHQGYRAHILKQKEGDQRWERVEVFLKLIEESERIGIQSWRDLMLWFLQLERKGRFNFQDDTYTDHRPNVISIMTDHGSKGLEFPIIIMGNIQCHRKKSGQQSPILWSDTYGMGCDYIDYIQNIRCKAPLLVHDLIEYEHEQALFAEKMRLIYVGMTRAEHALYIIEPEWLNIKKNIKSLCKGLHKQMRLLGDCDQKKYQASYLRQLTSMNEILAFADEMSMHHTNSSNAFKYLDLSQIVLQDFKHLINDQSGSKDQGNCKIESLVGDYHVDESIQDESIQDASDDDSSRLYEVQAVMATQLQAWLEHSKSQSIQLSSYLSKIPSKFSVSELKRIEAMSHVDLESDQATLVNQMTPSLVPLEHGIAHQLMDVSDCFELTKKAIILSPAELGTLLHRMYQIIPWSLLHKRHIQTNDAKMCTSDLVSIFEQLFLDYVAADMLTEIERIALRPFTQQFVAFLRSDLCHRMVQSEHRAIHSQAKKWFGVSQEMPFTLNVAVNDLAQEAFYHALRLDEINSTERIMIQGVIDLWFDEPDGVVLVDFKSDYIAGSDAVVQETFQKRYHIQMEMYEQAVVKATHKNMKERLIWSIRRGRSYRI